MEYLNWINDGKSGDILYCEFGVANGYTMTSAYFISRMYMNLKNMKFVGFDSFEGLPDTESQFDKHPKWKKGDYAFGVDTVKDNLVAGGMPESDFILVPGYFDVSLSDENASIHNIKNVAYVHIDCDYYTSAKTALDFIKPYLLDGAILDFDDYFAYASDNKGEPLALKQWVEENDDIEVRHFSQYGSAGNSFTVSRSSGDGGL